MLHRKTTDVEQKGLCRLIDKASRISSSFLAFQCYGEACRRVIQEIVALLRHRKVNLEIAEGAFFSFVKDGFKPIS
jgi:hypothetical protein